MAALGAVVMAAGEGRRLRPLTERWAKPVLPIGGRPVVAVLLHELAAAGIRDVTVVTGHLAEQVEGLVGDGSSFGVRARYARQPDPLGSADAVRRALSAGAGAPLLVTAADTVFRPGDLARAAERWRLSGAPAGLGVRPGGGDKTPVEAADDRVIRLGEGAPPGLTAAPVWFLGDEAVAAVAAVTGPPFELAAAFRDLIAAGTDVLVLELGPTRDLTRPEDVVLANFPYLWTESG